MASVRAFLLVLSTAVVSLLAFETQYECTTKLNARDIPEGSFYLRLSPAAVTNTSSSNSSSTNSTCPGDDQRVTTNLDCMCGAGLRNRQREIQERLQRTCKYYEEHTEPISSPLGFCERALTQLGRCVTFEPFPEDNSTDLYDASSLEMDVREIDGILSGYFGIIDRTLAGVYLRTEAHRCQCLELYKRWLCATKLTFYNSPPNSTTTDNGGPTSSSDGATMGEAGEPGRLRPCIGVCEDVLQSCPYYLPSRFQDGKSIIYGGYPAFDCPRPKICGLQENCSYGFGNECFGPRSSHGSILTISFYTFVILQSLIHISIYL